MGSAEQAAALAFQAAALAFHVVLVVVFFLKISSSSTFSHSLDEECGTGAVLAFQAAALAFHVALSVGSGSTTCSAM